MFLKIWLFLMLNEINVGYSTYKKNPDICKRVIYDIHEYIYIRLQIIV